MASKWGLIANYLHPLGCPSCTCKPVRYTGALAIRNIFDLQTLPLWSISAIIGTFGACYALFGGLKVGDGWSVGVFRWSCFFGSCISYLANG